MPDETQTAALRELRTHFPPTKREIETLSLSQFFEQPSTYLDIVFLIDTTGSMTDQIDDVALTLTSLSVLLVAHYEVVRYALITFKDEDVTEVVMDFGSASALAAELDDLVAAGGGDTSEDGYGAIMKMTDLTWSEQALRAAVMITDTSSHERGALFSEARNYLLASGAFFFYGLNITEDHYEMLAYDTYGARLVSTESAELVVELSNVLRGLSLPVEPTIYLVNDNANWTAQLETGEEVEFLRRSFAVNPYTSGEDGNVTVTITVDNTDLAVLDWLRRAKRYRVPVEATLRVYDSSDTTGPQNLPPLKLYATEFEVKGSTVTGQLRWLDLHNAPFPNDFYSPTRWPSLQ